MTLPPLATQLVGSYTKPEWLYSRRALMERQFDRVWVPDAAHLAAAHDDATALAIGDQVRAGLDVITDGEQRRQSFANYFYRLDGIDPGPWGVLAPRNDLERGFVDVSTEAAMAREPMKAPRVVGPLSWNGPIALDDLKFLKSRTDRPVKMTVIGPVTAADRLVDEYYGDDASIAFAMADALNAELRALDAEGVDIIQIDEPDIHMRRTRTNPYAAEAINRAVAGIKALTVVHLCYGYSVAMKNKRVDVNYGEVLETVARSNIGAINLEYEEPGHTPEVLRHCGDKIVMMGVLNLGTETPETPEHVASRIREAMTVVPPQRLMLSPDCGMWFLPRESAYAKIRAMALGAEIVRAELGLARGSR